MAVDVEASKGLTSTHFEKAHIPTATEVLPYLSGGYRPFNVSNTHIEKGRTPFGIGYKY